MAKKRVLFLCIHNASRSQIAEGLFKHLHGDEFDVYSAGSKPERVDDAAIKCLENIGIDISKNYSKDLKEFEGQEFDYVITVCEEACTFFPAGKNQINLQFEDPSNFNGSKQEKFELYTRIRDEIKDTLEELYYTKMAQKEGYFNLAEIEGGFEQMTDNKENGNDCCCDEKSLTVTEEDLECECGFETSQDDDCGCGDESSHDDDCGCGDESSQDDGCGCGAIEYPDISMVKNPDNPIFSANKEFIQDLEDYAHSLGIVSVGYTLTTPDLMIQNKFIQYPFTIVLTMEMDEDILKTPPGDDAKDLNDTAYMRLGILTTKISDYLRKNGYATEIAHPFGGLVNFSALGQKAGLGYIGNSGLLISPELGPKMKISAIFVSISNLPMNNENKHSWITNYCEICGKCFKACKEHALVQKNTENHKDIEFIKKLCIGCSQACTYCIEACPFYEKGYEQVKTKYEKIRSVKKDKSDPRSMV